VANAGCGTPLESGKGVFQRRRSEDTVDSAQVGVAVII
jgi:hypothetical protein